MRLIELVTGPWALPLEQLAELQQIYATHLRGDKIDVRAVEARLGRPLNNEPGAYELAPGGVAVLPIQGVIAPKANLMTQVSGGASAQLLTREVERAAADPAVRAIVLAIDSPGGSVYGVPELATAVRAADQIKPVYAWTDATMASAAYWVGSAARAVYISGPTVQLGSIGVVATHLDKSAAQLREGVVATDIFAGAYKRIASENAPLSEAGRQAMQDKVDYLYQVFVGAVADNRGVSEPVVLEHMADGRVFIGQQAIAAGLADAFATLPALLAALADNPRLHAQRVRAAPRSTPAAAAATAPAAALAADLPATPTEDAAMSDPTAPQAAPALTRQSIERDHPVLFAALRAEFFAAGAAAELDRIKAVRDQTVPGFEALVEGLAFDGKTTGDQAAAAVIRAQRQQLDGARAAHEADAPAAVAASHPAANSQDAKTAAEQAAEAKAHAAKHGTDFVAAMKALGYAS